MKTIKAFTKISISASVPAICDSAIRQHLLENPDCAKNYNGEMFCIIGKA